MLKLKKGARLSNQALSEETVNYFNEINSESNFFDKMTNFLLERTNISAKGVSEDQIRLAENVLQDLKQESNLEIADYFDYQKLYTVLVGLEFKIETAKSKRQGYLEIPLSAYEYKGNNKTKFLKSKKLSSLIYR